MVAADRIRLKVCGMRSVDEAMTAVRYGADAIGMISDAVSDGAGDTGSVPDPTIAEIVLAVPPSVATFLVTPETSVEGVVEHARRTNTSTLQLIGPVEPADHRSIRAHLLGIKLVQVLHVSDPDVVPRAEAAAGTVDALLLHADRRDDEGLLDGAGASRDWPLSRRVVEASPVPVFLAGGLDSDNVAEAIARVRPFGVDVRRGVRTFEDLNAGKLRAFVSAVNAAPRL